jgi:hypothetical protein
LTIKVIEKVDELMLTKNVSNLNTRIVMHSSTELHVLMGSGERNDTVDFGEVTDEGVTYRVKLVYGDF